MRCFIVDLDDTLAYTTRDLQGDPKRIPLLEPVAGALKFLQLNHGKCILLTAGVEKDQRQKIEVLDIGDYFSEIHIVSRPEEKWGKLEKIIKATRGKMKYKFSRIDVIVIGDRLDIELRRGKQLGCVTVRIKVPGGRHSDELAKYPLD